MQPLAVKQHRLLTVQDNQMCGTKYIQIIRCQSTAQWFVLIDNIVKLYKCILVSAVSSLVDIQHSLSKTIHLGAEWWLWMPHNCNACRFTASWGPIFPSWLVTSLTLMLQRLKYQKKKNNPPGMGACMSNQIQIFLSSRQGGFARAPCGASEGCIKRTHSLKWMSKAMFFHTWWNSEYGLK